MAALKAVHASEIPNHQLHDNHNASLALYSTRFSQGAEFERVAFKPTKFLVIGHRGNGMNELQSSSSNSDRRMMGGAFKENSILSFNTAANFPVDFIEFDVQVTKDGFPVIFHDDFILSQKQQQDEGVIYSYDEKRITDLSLAEFLSYSPLPLLRKTEDGRIVRWSVQNDDALCTLQQAFEKVVNPHRLGFNIELKFDDYRVYQQEHLIPVLVSVLQVVFDHGRDRPILFSTFHPDAALLLKKLQNKYPVFFLTDGGIDDVVYPDERRNSLEGAVKLCLEGGLEGMVCNVNAVLANPHQALTAIRDSKLSVLTYGKLNNVAEAVYVQRLMGIDGVIVDYVEQITEAVSSMLLNNPSQSQSLEKIQQIQSKFSGTDLSFLLKLIPQLLKQ